jgi:pimeloyl-ACP methyl ester carboxylesterase
VSRPTQVRTGTATVEGTELYYEVTGQGPPMVLVHGGEGTRIHWWQQVAAFAERFTCVTYDGRGFGASPPGEIPPSTNVQRDDLRSLLDHLGFERATLVGHSMGGAAASGVAQAWPERVERLVMSDTAFTFATPALSEWAGQMFDKINAGFDVLEHAFAPGFAERQPALAHLYRSLGRLNPPRRGPRGLEAYERWRDQPSVDYRSFAVPTLFIVGTEDELTEPWLIRATAAAVGGSELIEIPGAGHSAYAEQAAAFNEAVLGFCR